MASYDVCGKHTFPTNKYDVCGNSSYNMNYEKIRIESFIDWPLPFINVRELASDGFYYLHDLDKVACAFCSVGMCNFEADDIIRKEHTKWSPNCPLINEQETANIKLKDKYECKLEPTFENKWNDDKIEIAMHYISIVAANAKRPDTSYSAKEAMAKFDRWYKKLDSPTIKRDVCN